MPDPCLLVPMHVDALVVTERSVSNAFLRFKMSYDDLKNFGSPEPAPFAGKDDKAPDTGIHLHWTLPKALRKGEQKDGATHFPPIPNRWLIVRMSEQAGEEPENVMKAWLVESDYVDPEHGGSAYVDPTATSASDISSTRIGRVREWSLVDSAATSGRLFLRAVAPGSVIFTAYAPAVENVLAFYDKVFDNRDKEIPSGSFTYSVTGWYSDASQDPLKETTWEADKEKPGRFGNNKFDWLVWAGADNLPKRTVAHALAYSVSWNRSGQEIPAEKYPVDIPNKVKVAFGNSAVDALAGIVEARKGPRMAALLIAFQYGLLDEFDQPGSSELLNAAIRQHWYGATSSGTLWTIVPVERAASADVEPLSVAEKKALADLNGAQKMRDRAQRILESMLGRLYSLWWKFNYLINAPGVPETIADEFDWYKNQFRNHVDDEHDCAKPSEASWYYCKVKAQEARVRELDKKLKDAMSKVIEALPPDPAAPEKKKHQLKPISHPQFFHPNDPVVAITGLGRSTKFDPPRGVTCRVSSQTVAELTVDGTLYSTLPGRGVDLRGQIPPLADTKGLLPEGVQQLHTESVLVSPGLMSVRTKKSRKQVEDALKTLPDPAVSTRFASAPYSREPWTQPWAPLFLEWDVFVLKDPAYVGEPDNPFSVLQQGRWKFDGTSYLWNGPTEAKDEDFSEAETQIQMRGRTFLTPQIAFTFAGELKRYVDAHPGNRELRDLLDEVQRIEEGDVLSQRLSGFIGLMVERAYVQTLRPEGNIGELLSRIQPVPPLPYPNPMSPSRPVLDFAPMSGVFFLINQLQVIDSYGRVINIMMSNYSACKPGDAKDAYRFFYPYAGRGLKPVRWPDGKPISRSPEDKKGESRDATERMLQATPRFHQDTRLSFRLVSNEGHNRDIDCAADANPVCGWIVPNHLDRALSLYGPDGTSWGEMFLSLRHETTAPYREVFVPVWQPDPSNPNAPKTIDAIPNLYVRGILNELSRRSARDEGRAFLAFLLSIDETMWSVDPRGHRQDQDLAVLVGRPLAILRAELTLELRGLPYTNQDWQRTFKDPNFKSDAPAELFNENADVFRFKWPARIGSAAQADDGLIGYFVDGASGDFSLFNCVTPRPDTPSDFVRKIGQGGEYPELRPIDDSMEILDPVLNQVVRLTVLADPRCRVHAFTGILPAVSIEIPDEFTVAALKKIAYMFRSGPLLTPLDEVRAPLPYGVRGDWSWFDNTIKVNSKIGEDGEQASLASAPHMAREGWLTFKPDDGLRLNYEIVSISAPLRKSTTASLRIRISNAQVDSAEFKSMTLAIPIGEGPADLTVDPVLPDPSGIIAEGWTVKSGPGIITIAPPLEFDHKAVGAGQTLEFNVKGIRINQEAGTVKVGITENPYPPADARRGVRILDKI